MNKYKQDRLFLGISRGAMAEHFDLPLDTYIALEEDQLSVSEKNRVLWHIYKHIAPDLDVQPDGDLGPLGSEPLTMASIQKLQH